MAIQDSFKRKNTIEKVAVAPLLKPPSPEDLRFSMLSAQREVGKPVILSWKNPDKNKDDTYLLTVTLAAGAAEPTWILHVGHDEDSAIVWIYTSADTQMIHSMIGSIDQSDMPKGAVAEAELPVDEVMEEEAQQPLPHEEFAGSYELISRLGHGGMGIIYKARKVESQDIIALKVLHSHLLNDNESKKRFEQEAAACRDLKHRNLITMLEFGFSKHGQPYMTMEYLEGSSLSTIIDEGGRLEVRKFINIFTQICDGLNHAHQKGVVHRDVKPSNVMIIKSEAGVDIAKILDFGIAKRHVEENKDNLTPTGNVLGSPAYIAPEQCAGADADPRSDIYSLGCVMYEALTGQPPFVHDSAIKVLLMQLSEVPTPLGVMCPDVEFPLELETIVMRCLEKDP
ncbi:MAG: serine/threonine protein kinase, partial [Candidatus Obscuribacterales bacterium]|nr:serine/threonine protein kinase [Candidatus Obscuribacterales bacterium]